MSLFLPITLLLLIAGCAPKAIVVAPIAPAAAKAHEAAKAASVSARRVTEATVSASAASISLGFEVSKALAEADRQRKDSSIPPEVAAMNFETLTRIAALGVQVERASKQAVVEAAAHEDDAVKAATVTGEVAVAAVAQDKAVVAIKDRMDGMEADAARGRALLAVYWIVGILTFAFVAFKLARRFGFL